MSKMMIQYSAASDRGQRQSNQDNLRIGEILCSANTDEHFEISGLWETDVPQLLCVCDGIGGESLGDVASVLALESVNAVAAEWNNQNQDLEELVLDAAEEAQNRVVDFFQRLGHAGGCTMTLAGVYEGKFALLNIGDSPAFLWKKTSGEMTELSCRHNLEWHKRRMGVVPGENDASYLMRFLGRRGCSAARMANVVTGKLDPGDRMLLCSDGITNAIAQEALCRELSGSADAAKLVKQAALIPNADNCTTIIFEYQSATPDR